MSRYRVLEIKDKLINKGEPYWKVQKLVLGLWWSDYFEEHSEWGATFYDRDTALTWWNYHIDKTSRIESKVIAGN